MSAQLIKCEAFQDLRVGIDTVLVLDYWALYLRKMIQRRNSLEKQLKPKKICLVLMNCNLPAQKAECLQGRRRGANRLHQRTASQIIVMCSYII